MSAPKQKRVPAYFDAFLDAVRQGARIDHIHLGHWDTPEDAGDDHQDFEAAQARMAEKLLAMGALESGMAILDAGCGFGGLARLAGSGFPQIFYAGLNIDPRQLAVCRDAAIRTDHRFRWIAADACALPFANASFHRLFCVEAIFHFASRRQFLAEAFRVLKPGGLLVLSDILLTKPKADIGVPVEAIEHQLETDLGPWPQMWISLAELRNQVTASGFMLQTEEDATANTLPSYRTIAPSAHTRLTGPAAMRILQEQGYLSYVYLRLAKPASPSPSA